MKYLVVILLLAAVAVAQTYTTNFPLTEDPISEGGKWINAGVVGLDWSNVRATPGFAFGTNSGTVAFADSWALLAGTWGSDQIVQAAIKDQNPADLAGCFQDIELVLRGNLSAHSATGYEITVRATNDANSYLLIARWNGLLGKFTVLEQLSGSAYGVKTGDVFKATMVGNVTTAYINGVQKAKVTDNRYATGHPGMGFYRGIQASCSGTNADYGYTNYTAVAIRSSSFVQANSGPSTIQSSNSSVAVSYLNPQTAGNLNIAVVGWGDTTYSISSINDTQGNTYSRAVGPTSGTGLQQSIYYAKNIIGGSNEVTVTFNHAAAYPDVRILEYKGLSTTSPLDVTAAETGTGTAANSGSGTTSGGTAVTITGTGFLTGATLKLGGTTATNVTVTSSSTMTATTAAHTAGTVDVVATNTDSQSGTLSSGYTYTSSSNGAVRFVQVNYKTSNPSGSSLAVAYPSAQTAANLNIVVVGWNDTTSTVSSVVDSRGNTYTRAVGATAGTALTQSIYYAKNIAGGSNTVTVTFNKAASYPDVRVLEYSGLNTTNPLDARASAMGSGSLANSGSATTMSATELIFGAGMTGGVITRAGTGFTSRVITHNGDIAEDKTVTNTGSYNVTAPVTPYAGSSTWVMQMATFKP